MATDEDKAIVEAFFEVVKEQGFVFDEESQADLSTIKQTLAEFENQPVLAAAEPIIAWYKKYPDVRDAVLFTAKEITIKKRNPANQEGTLINQFPDYKKIIDDRQNNIEEGRRQDSAALASPGASAEGRRQSQGDSNPS